MAGLEATFVIALSRSTLSVAFATNSSLNNMGAADFSSLAIGFKAGLRSLTLSYSFLASCVDGHCPGNKEPIEQLQLLFWSLAHHPPQSL